MASSERRWLQPSQALRRRAGGVIAATADEGRMTKTNPGNYFEDFRLGQVLVHLGKFPEAAAQFHEALRQQPDFPDAKKDWDALLAAHPELK